LKKLQRLVALCDAQGFVIASRPALRLRVISGKELTSISMVLHQRGFSEVRGYLPRELSAAPSAGGLLLTRDPVSGGVPRGWLS